MQARILPRGTPPHLPILSASLAPLMGVVPGQAFHLRYQDGAVIIEQSDWTGVNLAAVEAAVANAPAHTDKLDAKAEVDAMPLYLKAFFLVLVDEINRLRQQPSTTFAAITPAQAWTAIKSKVDSL